MTDILYEIFILSLFLAAQLATTTARSHIEATFGTSSPMVAIAQCESTLRQFDAPNHVLRGHITPADVGLFQINYEYHGEKAKKMGINLYSLDGNIQYAEYLYTLNGTRDWEASKSCWKKLIRPDTDG